MPESTKEPKETQSLLPLNFRGRLTMSTVLGFWPSVWQPSELQNVPFCSLSSTTVGCKRIGGTALRSNSSRKSECRGWALVPAYTLSAEQAGAASPGTCWFRRRHCTYIHIHIYIRQDRARTRHSSKSPATGEKLAPSQTSSAPPFPLRWRRGSSRQPTLLCFNYL